MSDISERGSDFIRDLGESARKNPVSAALIGMGILWLFTGNRPVERAGEIIRRSGFDRIPDVAGDAFEAARSTFRSGADSLGEQVASANHALRDAGAGALDSAARFGREQVDTAAEYARSIPGSATNVLDRARANLADLFEAQPLALGAVGLAIGAGIAAALPTSEAEINYMGETSDAVRAKAADFAAEQTTRATEVAGDVLEAVTEEAHKQGLTVEGAQSAVGEISKKIGRVVETAKKGVSEQVKSKAP
jgi:hypothetical protein